MISPPIVTTSTGWCWYFQLDHRLSYSGRQLAEPLASAPLVPWIDSSFATTKNVSPDTKPLGKSILTDHQSLDRNSDAIFASPPPPPNPCPRLGRQQFRVDLQHVILYFYFPWTVSQPHLLYDVSFVALFCSIAELCHSYLTSNWWVLFHQFQGQCSSQSSLDEYILYMTQVIYNIYVYICTYVIYMTWV